MIEKTNAEAGIFDENEENGEEEYDGQGENGYGQEEGVDEEDEQDLEEDDEPPSGPIQGGMYEPESPEGEPQYDEGEVPN